MAEKAKAQAIALLQSYVDRILAIDLDGNGPLAGRQKEVAQKQYSSLKADLKNDVERLDEGTNQPEQIKHELPTLRPALTEALAELREPANSTKRRKLQSELFSAKKELVYYLSPLKL